MNSALQRGLASVVSSLRGNGVPEQPIRDAVSDAYGNERDRMIAAYAARIQCLAAEHIEATLNRHFLPGIDDSPIPAENGRKWVKTAKRG